MAIPSSGYQNQVETSASLGFNMVLIPLEWNGRICNFSEVGQTSRSRSQGVNYGTMLKVLSKGLHMCNMKALPLLVWTLWSRLKFFKRRPNFKVKVMRSTITVPSERSCHKEYTYTIWSLITSGTKVMTKVKSFCSRTQAHADPRAMTLAPPTFDTLKRVARPCVSVWTGT